jgi:hypothetical protein
VRRLLTSATVMYMAALAMSGLAVLLTVFLPPGERGLLVATTASATIAVAVGGLSMETFLLARGRAWLDGAGRRSAALYASTVPLSAALGWAIGVFSAEASPGLAALGAGLIAAGVLPAAAGLTHDRFYGVYLVRALLAAATPMLYAALILGGVDTAGPWLAAWLGGQAGLAAAMWVWHGRPLLALLARPSAGAEGAGRLARAHGGAVAYVVTYRFDQIALARYQGADALAVYSLAVTALEFAQAGAVVGAQRVLGDHSSDSAARLPGAIRRAVLHAIGIGLLAVAGLGVIAWWSADYRDALLLGVVLLPRTVAVVVDRILNARLVNQHGEGASLAIATGTALAAAVSYVVVVPVFGGIGAAVVAAVLFSVEAALVWVAIRRRVPAHA